LKTLSLSIFATANLRRQGMPGRIHPNTYAGNATTRFRLDLGAIFHEEMKAFFTDSKKLSVNLRQAEQTMYKATKPPCEKQAAPAKHAVENMAIEPATKQFFLGKSQMLVTA
jgi:hypothetical protein